MILSGALPVVIPSLVVNAMSYSPGLSATNEQSLEPLQLSSEVLKPGGTSVNVQVWFINASSSGSIDPLPESLIVLQSGYVPMPAANLTASGATTATCAMGAWSCGITAKWPAPFAPWE